MKIMLFSHIGGSRIITGAEKYLLLLTRELGRYADCTLVVPEEGLLSGAAKAAGIRTVIHEVPVVWQMFNPGPGLVRDVEAKLNQGEHKGIINLLHMHQPDLVIVNTCLNALPAVAAKTLGLPVGWFATEKITENDWTGLTVGFMNRYSDWIIGISETTLRPIRTHLAESGAKVHLLPPTWLLEELCPGNWPEHREVRRLELGIRTQQQLIGYISSSLHEEKGLEHFVTMAVEVALRHPHSRFLIVGNVTDKAYFDRCSQQIKASGCGNRFHWKGFDPRIDTLFPALDILVVPSLIDEGFGLTAAEGLLFGISVVAYRAGGLEEIMLTIGNDSGLVEKGDAAGLAVRVLALLDSGAAGLEERRAANRASIEAAYGIEAYRQRLKLLVTQFQGGVQQWRDRLHAQPIRFLDPRFLVKGEHSSAVFLLEHGEKRPFASEETLRFYRYGWGDVRQVPDALLATILTGAEIRHKPPSVANRPFAMLAKGSGPAVYLLSHQRRQVFASALAMRQRGYSPDRVVQLPDEELLQLPLGEPLRACPAGRGKRVQRTRRARKGRRLLRRRLGKEKRVLRSGRVSRGGRTLRTRHTGKAKRRVGKARHRSSRMVSRGGTRRSARRRARRNTG
ncbi:glycosyltransferase family 4 protein [Paenibacillus filicis]|uniref:Glycosyltransferase family 4 protein n=1 Tax=Paenibacillus filicis TaxID=669464 RepID=A0ABU9DQX7_9BACL